MEWTNEKVITFLEILQTEPCLWNPEHKNYKNRASQNDAWRRIMISLPFESTIHEMKKKKETLMGYYRIHLNKFKKSLKSDEGTNDVYSTNWFAYKTMDNFLRVVYESDRKFITEMNEYSEASEKSKRGVIHDNQKSNESPSHFEVASNNSKAKSRRRDVKNQSSQYICLKLSRSKRQQRRNLSPEIKLAQCQVTQALGHVNDKKDDEYEIFGRLLASKLHKMRNSHTREILMNDINNLVFRTCMMDRLEEQSKITKITNDINSSPSTFRSLQRQLFSPHTNQSSSEKSTSQFLYQQNFITPPNLPTSHIISSGTPTSQPQRLNHQSFIPFSNASPNLSSSSTSTTQSIRHQLLSSLSNSSQYQLTSATSISQPANYQAFNQSPNLSSYQSSVGSPPRPQSQFFNIQASSPSSYHELSDAASQSARHKDENPLPRSQSSVQTQESSQESQTSASQLFITDSGNIMIFKETV